MTNSEVILEGKREVLIPVPPGEIYAYICDFTRHTEWNSQPLEITKVSEGPVDVGTVFRAREGSPGTGLWILRKAHDIMLKLLPWAGYTEAEITALEPDRRLAWKAAFPLTTGGYWMKAEWEIELEPHNGVTRVTQRYLYKPQHSLSRIMSRLMFKTIGSERASRPVAQNIDANLNQLKMILEGRSGRGPA